MFCVQNSNLLSKSLQISKCLFATAALNVQVEKPLKVDWEHAKPFNEIPGPTKLQLISSFMPGGAYSDLPQDELNQQLREKYGDIFLIPGVFKKRPLVYTCNPNDIEMVYRTEGVYPVRRGFDILTYHRTVHRKDVFEKTAGVVSSQGHDWGNIRSIVNPVLMDPKAAKIYINKMSQVVDEFADTIRRTRDEKTKEVQDNFREQMNLWAMESVSLVALDTRLGLLAENVDSELQAKAKKFLANAGDFFDLMFEYEGKVSVWKYVHTKGFKRLLAALDGLTYFAKESVEKAIDRFKLEEAQGLQKPDDEKSVLERLIKVHPDIAMVMALDMVIAGTDTTTTAMTSCLLNLAKNPEKQAKLREEVTRILPEKDSQLTQESMKNLPYLRACIKESLRMLPVTFGNFRTTGQDVVLSGYQVPKDTDIVMPNQLLLRDAKYFDRPNEFLPERFLRDRSTNVDVCPVHQNKDSAFVLLPFGFGPRNCVGKRIVELEMEILLMKFIRNFEIRFDHPTEGLFKTLLINVPQRPLKFKFTDL